MMHAQALTAARRRWREGRWFIVALLMALASAIVPAICTHGLPATRSFGSAFDPATSAVALRGRTQEIVRTVALTDDRDDKRAGSAPAMIGAAPPREESRSTVRYARQDSIRAPAPLVEIRRVTRAQPRAPPSAIG